MPSGRRNRDLRKKVELIEQSDRGVIDALLSGDVTLVRQQVSVQRFSGPLPPPEVLEKYEAIAPGIAAELIGMVKSQMLHRQSIEGQVVKGNVDAQKRGQNFALIVTILAFVTALILAWMGYPIVAGTVVGINLTALAGIFITSKYMQGTERKKKDKARHPASG